MIERGPYLQLSARSHPPRCKTRAPYLEEAAWERSAESSSVRTIRSTPSLVVVLHCVATTIQEADTWRNAEREILRPLLSLRPPLAGKEAESQTYSPLTMA